MQQQSGTNMDLLNKTALVTGGTTGIGRASAVAFRQAGAQVTITGVDRERLKAAERELPDGVTVLQADVRLEADAECLAAHVRNRYGGLDVLFLNAGIARLAPLDAVDEAHYSAQLDVNVKGAVLTLRALLPLLRPGASVILNTSVANTLGVAGMSVYSATKGALAALVPALAVELAARQVRINAISPGIIRTAIQGKFGLPEDVQSAVDQKFLARIPLGRFGEAAEVAELALFLASARASYLNGTEIRIDGGLAVSA